VAGLSLTPRLLTWRADFELAERARVLARRVDRLTTTRGDATDSRAIIELRDLVRGIYPPVLADRGLAEAVRNLALDTVMDVEVSADLPAEPPMPVAAAVYFAVAEILTNVVQHARAETVQISVRHVDGVLRAWITDDGLGGADPARGTGLAGVERRLAPFDGILAVSSPAGGPTIVAIEVPCALSSVKISSS
jgi:signal transduction histidine kinase